MKAARQLGPFAAGLIAAALFAGAAAATTLSVEPRPGRLRAGETVLVDDGSCPAGEVKQVTGGSDASLSTGGKRAGSRRTRRCVARP